MTVTVPKLPSLSPQVRDAITASVCARRRYRRLGESLLRRLGETLVLSALNRSKAESLISSESLHDILFSRYICSAILRKLFRHGNTSNPFSTIPDLSTDLDALVVYLGAVLASSEHGQIRSYTWVNAAFGPLASEAIGFLTPVVSTVPAKRDVENATTEIESKKKAAVAPIDDGNSSKTYKTSANKENSPASSSPRKKTAKAKGGKGAPRQTQRRVNQTPPNAVAGSSREMKGTTADSTDYRVVSESGHGSNFLGLLAQAAHLVAPPSSTPSAREKMSIRFLMN